MGEIVKLTVHNSECAHGVVAEQWPARYVGVPDHECQVVTWEKGHYNVV